MAVARTNLPGMASAERTRIDRYYRWISRFYGIHERWFEKSLREKAIEFLSPSPDERVLEIGCGTGLALREIAQRVGPSGFSHGLDISLPMLEQAREICDSACRPDPLLLRGNAGSLPYQDGSLDGAYMSGVLELYGHAQRVRILSEAKRVLKAESGRLALAVMSNDGKALGLLRFYEWVRDVLPGIIPCRSVEVDRLVSETGFEVRRRERLRLKGVLPIEVVLLGVGSESPTSQISPDTTL
ncbi:MAG: methyltransferase domain-containing protein [Candidatus Eisenbacteria sp.]|nr:methyltransferase domain-containing protein [Candidatus Eisenbacteria bacterium]